MTSRLDVTRQFKGLNTNVSLATNYTGTTVVYTIVNKTVTGAGANITFNWFMDVDFSSFATGASFVSYTSTGISGLNFSVSLPWFMLLSAVPAFVMPPGSKFSVTVQFDRIISTGAYNSFVKGTNWNIFSTPSASQTAGTNNTLTLNLQNPGTPAVDATKSFASGPGLVSPTANTLQTFTIQARDATDTNLTHGGAAFDLTLSGSGNSTRAIVDNHDGTYTASYTVSTAGTWTINVTNATGTFIRDFPIVLTVT